MRGLSLYLPGLPYRRLVWPARDRLIVADAVVVPGLALRRDGRARGLLQNRVAMAALLLRRGLAPRLLLSGGKPRAGVTEAERMAGLAERLGVPRAQLLLEPAATSSRENARCSARLLGEAGPGSGLLVSDSVHLSYALPVFMDAFAQAGLRLGWCRVDYGLLRRERLFAGFLRAV